MNKTNHDLVQMCIDPRSQANRAALGFAIRSLREQNACLNASIDPATGGAVIRAASEADLDTALDFMGRFHVDMEIGPLQVVYRMSITNSVEIDYTHKKRTGATGEFARVKLIASPNEAGMGFQFKSTTVSNIVPDTYIPGVEKGVLSVIQSGSLTAVPGAVDINVVLVDGAFHDIDSSVLTFEIASRAALLEALRMTSLALFEPIMKVEVVVPEDHTATIIEDLKSRSGRIEGQVSRGDDVLIDAMVPLSKMLGYADTLDEFAPGRATHTIQFDHYLQVFAGASRSAFSASRSYTIGIRNPLESKGSIDSAGHFVSSFVESGWYPIVSGLPCQRCFQSSSVAEHPGGTPTAYTAIGGIQ